MVESGFVGREGEAEMIASLMECVDQHGGALVVRGEAGIGKSALLTEASRLAKVRGMQVMSTAGVQSETNLPFAGLHQLLRPVLAQIDDLPSLQRDAMRAAFGMADAVVPEPFLIALAALELLSGASGRAPVALVVEDAQWLDRPSGDALAFVGRRVESDPIVLLAAIREGYESSLLEAGLPELQLGGLADRDARKLLDACFPELAPAVRKRLLDEAKGHPLALLELPVALGSSARGGEVVLPTRLPLSARIEHAFVSREAVLPSATRTLLRIAAVDDDGVLGEIMSAAEIACSVGPTVEDLVPAVRAQLIEVDGPWVRFRHPLVRSAIYQAASVAERHAAHAALAEVLADDPDRRVWHRAAAAVGMDQAVTSELEATAHRAQRRGAITTAVAAFERAAALTADPVRRSAMLLSAAEAASELGRSEMVMRLLREADSIELGAHERAHAMWLGDPFREGHVGDSARVQALAETARRMAAEGDTDLALNLLSAAAFRCFWADLGEHAAHEVLRAADQIKVAPDHPKLLQIQAYAAPIERGAVVTGHLASSIPPADPDALYLLGTAACLVGEFEQSSTLLGASAARLREQGRLRLLAQVLETRAWTAIMIDEFGVAVPAAEEAGRLAAETAQPLWQTGALIAQATLAALRGEQAMVGKLTAEAERVGLPVRAAGLLALVQYARGLSALGQGRHAEAYDQLRRLYEPADPAHHRLFLCFAIGDLAEAAAHSDHRDHGRAIMRQLEPLARETPSPWFSVAMLYARAVLADDQDAGAVFEDALARDLTPWPLARARLQLASGEWLRRQRRSLESRAPLRAARDAFEALGVGPWAERARQELRASGESTLRRTPDKLNELTAQELQIVQMAAGGLSNREIGQRLYLSHRTVESHLYRVFPKLGVSSRAQLAGVLGGRIGAPA
jgi:DNA-binding CsgD family transcriptional regulator